MSSHQRLRLLQYAVEMAGGEVALEKSRRFAATFAFGDAALDVSLRRRVVLASMNDDRVQGPVELAVAAVAEAMPPS